MATPPKIFDPARRRAVRRRIAARQSRPDAARFVIEDMVEDVLDRLSFVRHEPGRTLVIGEWAGALAAALERQGAEVTQADAGELDEEQPYPESGFDLIVSLGTLDTVNDLPGR